MIPPAIPDRVGRLLPLLGSDKPGEVVNTCRAILRDIVSVGLDWHDVKIVPKGEGGARTPPFAPAPMPNFFDITRACRDVYGAYLTNWERLFVTKMCRLSSPTPREMEQLTSIFARVQRRAA